MRLSATGIKAYLTCPRRYRYAYVDRVPAVPTGPLVFGSIVHAAIHEGHRLCLSTGTAMDAEAGIEAFRRLWAEALRRERPLFKDGRATQDAYTALGERILRGYADAHPKSPPTIALEHRFELPWRDHVLSGVVDRIDEGDQGLVIYELKTSQKRPTTRELNTDLQLTIYAYAVTRAFHRPVERLVHYHLRGTEAIATRRTDASFRYLLGSVFPHVSQAVTAGLFGPTPSWHCRLCDYRELCAAEKADALRRTIPLGLRADCQLDAALESILMCRPSPLASVAA